MLMTDLPETMPATMPEFLARFGSSAACREYLLERRWPEGFVCTGCSHRRCYWLTKKTNVCECAGCGSQTSILTGTVFEQTKTALSTWFLAIYLFAGSKGGISALELQRQLGFKSDQTAWTWLHKLRAAMSVRGKPLDGRVEVDEAYVGGVKAGKRGRGAAGKSLVAGAVEARSFEVVAPDPARLRGIARTLAERVAERLAGGGESTRRCLGRIRLGKIADVSANSLECFIKSSIAPGATIVSDGWRAYLGATKDDYKHDRIILSKTEGKAHEYLPGPHLIFALLKRVLLGTYHGGVSAGHLPAYLDEFTFRSNRRGMTPAGRAMRLIDRAVATLPVPNHMILRRTKIAT